MNEEPGAGARLAPGSGCRRARTPGDGRRAARCPRPGSRCRGRPSRRCRRASSGGTPGPSSVTAISTRSSARVTATRLAVPPWVAALSSRMLSASATSSGRACTRRAAGLPLDGAALGAVRLEEHVEGGVEVDRARVSAGLWATSRSRRSSSVRDRPLEAGVRGGAERSCRRAAGRRSPRRRRCSGSRAAARGCRAGRTRSRAASPRARSNAGAGWPGRRAAGGRWRWPTGRPRRPGPTAAARSVAQPSKAPEPATCAMPTSATVRASRWRAHSTRLWSRSTSHATTRCPATMSEHAARRAAGGCGRPAAESTGPDRCSSGQRDGPGRSRGAAAAGCATARPPRSHQRRARRRCVSRSTALPHGRWLVRDAGSASSWPEDSSTWSRQHHHGGGGPAVTPARRREPVEVEEQCRDQQQHACHRARDQGGGVRRPAGWHGRQHHAASDAPVSPAASRPSCQPLTICLGRLFLRTNPRPMPLVPRQGLPALSRLPFR